jgi:hypothetical protein
MTGDVVIGKSQMALNVDVMLRRLFYVSLLGLSTHEK